MKKFAVIRSTNLGAQRRLEVRSRRWALSLAAIGCLALFSGCQQAAQTAESALVTQADEALFRKVVASDQRRQLLKKFYDSASEV